jgi:hypothetical protein
MHNFSAGPAFCLGLSVLGECSESILSFSVCLLSTDGIPEPWVERGPWPTNLFDWQLQVKDWCLFLPSEESHNGKTSVVSKGTSVNHCSVSASCWRE